MSTFRRLRNSFSRKPTQTPAKSVKQRSAYRDDMVRAPLNRSDPRFLGIGSSKAVWIKVPNADRGSRPKDNTVIVNSLEEQRTFFGKKPYHLEEYYQYLENEYEFTIYLKTLFPNLIPNVKKIEDILPVGPFRYAKERCYPLPKNAELFHHMIRISDAFNYLGWAYLDIKPDNLGFRNKKIMLLDTDPYCFYKIPETSRPFYRVSCHMIILLFCLNHIPDIPHSVLCSFIHSRGYSYETFSKTYKEAEAYDKDYHNKIEEIVKENKNFLVYKNMVKLPKDFFDAYGNYYKKTSLERLNELFEETIDLKEKNKLMSFSCDVTLNTKEFSRENSPINWKKIVLKGPKGTSLNGPRV